MGAWIISVLWDLQGEMSHTIKLVNNLCKGIAKILFGILRVLGLDLLGHIPCSLCPGCSLLLLWQGKWWQVFSCVSIPGPEELWQEWLGVSVRWVQKDTLLLCLCWIFSWDRKWGDLDFQRRLQNGGWDVGRELRTCTGDVEDPHIANHPLLWFMFLFLPSCHFSLRFYLFLCIYVLEIFRSKFLIN